MPMRSFVPPTIAAHVHDDQRTGLDAAVRTEGSAVQGVAIDGGQTPPIGPGTFLWSEAATPRWRAAVHGHAVPQHAAFGWTNGYTLATNDTVKMSYHANPMTALVRAVEILLALFVVIAWFVTRRAAPDDESRPDEAEVLDLTADETAPTAADVEASAPR
jgi:hypothetical protein